MSVLQFVGELLPQIAKRGDEIEQTRGLPPDLLSTLTEAGCLRMMTPVGYGGHGMPIVETLPVIESLAGADGSVAWAIGQVVLSQLIIGCASDETVAAAYAGGPDLYAAGAVAPKGRATFIDGGWRVTGQWPFVTGCERATWLYLNCVLVRDRAVQRDDTGKPATRIIVLPARESSVVDTWHTLGLRGTGSHDVAVNGVVCPAERGIELAEGSAATDRAVAGIAQSSLIIAAVATGIAGAALRDVTELASGGKRPSLSPTRLAASTTFQDRLGEAHTQWRAARALLYAAGGEGTTRMSALDRAQTRAAAAQITTMATQVVDTAYSLAGGSAAYDTSPLQRRLRDVHTATQHFVAGRSSFAAVGAILVGEQVDTGAL